MKNNIILVISLLTLLSCTTSNKEVKSKELDCNAPSRDMLKAECQMIKNARSSLHLRGRSR